MEPQTLTEEQDEGLSWILARTLFKRQNSVARLLTAQGFETIVVEVTIRKRVGDRIRRTNLCLFTDYVFIRCKIDDQRVLAQIRNTTGVSEIIGPGRQPQIVPDEDIDQIRAIIEETSRQWQHKVMEASPSKLEAYTPVRIIGENPYAGMRGILMSDVKPGHPAEVCLLVFGRPASAPVRIDPRNLEVIRE